MDANLPKFGHHQPEAYTHQAANKACTLRFKHITARSLVISRVWHFDCIKGVSAGREGLVEELGVT